MWTPVVIAVAVGFAGVVVLVATVAVIEVFARREAR